MTTATTRFAAAAALLLGAAASAVPVRAWLGERALAEARRLQGRGDILAAASRYEEALARGRPRAATELARLALLRRRWDEAGAFARRALALEPAAAEPHVLLASVGLSRPGAWTAAREEEVLAACRTAAALDPLSSAVRTACAEAALELAAVRRQAWPPERVAEVLEEAAAGYARSVELGPRQARATLATALARGAPPMFAVRAAAAGEGSAPLAAAVGLLLERGVWEVTEPDFWAGAEGSGETGRFAQAAADALGRAGRVPEAIAAARRGLAAAPESAELWFALGQLLRRAKSAPDAQAALRRAAELRPDNAAYRKAAGL